MSAPVVPSVLRRRLALGLVLGLAACGGGGGGGAAPPTELVNAAATIGPAGGVVAITDGVHAGVSLEVPPGALAAPTRITITADVGKGRLLGMFPVYRFAPRDLVAASGAFTVTVRGGDQLFADGASEAAVFRQVATDAPWTVQLHGTVDVAQKRVRCPSDRLGDFVGWNGGLHRLFTTERFLPDPAVATPAENVAGFAVVVPNGTYTLTLGRGTLASFWTSPPQRNLLIVPGLLGSPIDFDGAGDLVANLQTGVQNIVVLNYPSAPGVAATANALYDLLRANAQPGFGCSIVGHSMGGLVARYLLEQSHRDTARAGYRVGDPQLDAVVPHLVMLGVPNAGSDLGTTLLSGLLPYVGADEQGLLQAAIDISYRNDAITMQMNAAYVDNATRYHVLYGDLGAASDGVVTVASALALPLFAGETQQVFPVAHDALHVQAQQNGVRARIDQILQIP
jgi:pimeloyl-ACP methyl ester carboxylesterase